MCGRRFLRSFVLLWFGDVSFVLVHLAPSLDFLGGCSMDPLTSSTSHHCTAWSTTVSYVVHAVYSSTSTPTATTTTTSSVPSSTSHSSSSSTTASRWRTWSTRSADACFFVTLDIAVGGFCLRVGFVRVSQVRLSATDLMSLSFRPSRTEIMVWKLHVHSNACSFVRSQLDTVAWVFASSSAVFLLSLSFLTLFFFLPS